MKAHIWYCILVACSVSAYAQDNAIAKGKKDVDLLALKVVKAVTDPLYDAKSYSFRALISRDALGSDGQIVTMFHESSVVMEKPDKLHIDVGRGGDQVQLLLDGGQAVLYSPKDHLYTSVAAPKTIDAALESLEKKDIFIPIRNFLVSDPYHSLTDDLTAAYVVGRMNIFGEEVHQLVFREPHAEWQLWVTGGEEPRIVRLQVIDTSKPGHPRTTVQFLDWDFSPSLKPDLFAFNKPADAQKIEILTEQPSK